MVIGAVPAHSGPDQRQGAAAVDATAAAFGTDGGERLDSVLAHGAVKQRQGTSVVDPTATAVTGAEGRYAAEHNRYVDSVPGHGTVGYRHCAGIQNAGSRRGIMLGRAQRISATITNGDSAYVRDSGIATDSAAR